MQKKYIKRTLNLTIEDFKKLKPYRGQVLKYKTICNILKTPMYAGAEAGGQQQVNHIEKMKRFADFRRVESGYKIVSIYTKEKAIAKKHKRRCKFADTTRILEHNLAEKTSSVVIVSQNIALELGGFVNPNFNVARQNIEKAANVLEVGEEILRSLVLGHHANRMKLNFTHTIANARAVKFYKKDTVVAKGGSHTLASDKDREEIKASEQVGLRVVRCKTPVGAFMKGTKTWKRYQKVTRDNLKEIDYYYTGYKIRFNRKAVKTTERTYQRARANVQNLVSESILKSLKRAKAEAHIIEQMKKLIGLLIKDTTFDLAEALA